MGKRKNTGNIVTCKPSDMNDPTSGEIIIKYDNGEERRVRAVIFTESQFDWLQKIIHTTP